MRPPSTNAPLAFFLAVVLLPYTGVAQQFDPQIERGMELFLHEWQQSDPLAGGDGLGPLHNEVSCLKCHFLRSPGGAGPLETNIQLISAIPRLDDTPEAEQNARAQLARIHPSFALGEAEARRSIVLHRHDTHQGYNEFRATLLGRSPGNLPILEQGLVESHLRVLVNAEGIAWLVSERNSPALFGAGLIDRLPDSVFTQTAARQGQGGIKGIVPRAMNGRVGRFGWRGQASSLESFVGTAFAVELGLSNAMAVQEPSPLEPGPVQQAPSQDVTLSQIRSVTTFIQALPQPRLEAADSASLQLRVERGRASFNTIGCTACHVQNLGGIRNIFSDLLLHDMGASLADPVPGPLGVEPAEEEQPGQGNQSAPVPTGGGSYAGPSVDVFRPINPAGLRLWRTPPLWGVRDSAPYLHDGRAGTLRRAVILHDGEGEASRNRFLGLQDDGQTDLLLFLAHLRAPQLIGEPNNE